MAFLIYFDSLGATLVPFEHWGTILYFSQKDLFTLMYQSIIIK
jgi:hypothetical protein